MMRNLEELNSCHEGRPCFIVAAGTSVHYQNVEALKDHVVIAVNSGYLAAPWATYFVSDDWSMERWSFFYNDLRSSKHTQALLYEDKLGTKVGWFGDRAVLFRHRKGISIPDKYRHKDKKFHLGETRTSTGTAMMIAHIMKCSPVVLLGVDCCRQNSMRYFWQLPHKLSPFRKEAWPKPKRNDGIPEDRYRVIKNSEITTDFDLKDMTRTWDDFGEAMNEKCRVYNTSDVSLLKVFPKVNLEKFLEDLNDSK